ncbi:hypothetical protein PRZ48_012094 [Zasmidium cellare]|uniref:F-box domain-containing protein n=1 Tax=Zasmidium cellare TaxID=395010 RepID=A0ABR0E3W7_ZASCE|nr:hypothetical protein PRZ48_012094 [Zasmidium cellare]
MQSQTARAAAQDNDMWDPPGWMVIEQANNNDRPTEYTGSAGARVVDIVEILEMTLLELPPSAMFQLFTMQRVSKALQGTIAGSVKLQRRMFLLPDERLPRARLNLLLKNCAFSAKAGFDWRSVASLLIPVYRHVLGYGEEQDETLDERSENDLGREVLHRHYNPDSDEYPKSQRLVQRRYPLLKNKSTPLTGEGAPGWTRMLIAQPAMPSIPDDLMSRLRD